jgi:hypothetical protein
MLDDARDSMSEGIALARAGNASHCIVRSCRFRNRQLLMQHFQRA